MASYDGFLLRDSLGDTGVVPSPGYPYYSPDLIAHAQVANPQTFFAGNYGSDPNEAVELGSRLNRIYVRAKNLSANPLSGYYVSVFRAQPALFLTPSVWRNNPLSTASGNPYLALPPTVQPNAVGVGQDCFMLDAIASNLFCLVGIASPQPQPAIPSNFSTYSDYLVWVRGNQSVCGRNLNMVRDFPNRSLERLEHFSNPSATETVPTLFQVSIVGGLLPAGSTFGLQCAPLGINTTWKISEGTVKTTSGMTPPLFDGTVTTWATLAPGTVWPPGVGVNTSVWVGLPPDDKAAPLATPFEQLGVRPEEVEGLPANGVLVRLGNVETVFVAQ